MTHRYQTLCIQANRLHKAGYLQEAQELETWAHTALYGRQLDANQASLERWAE